MLRSAQAAVLLLSTTGTLVDGRRRSCIPVRTIIIVRPTASLLCAGAPRLPRRHEERKIDMT